LIPTRRSSRRRKVTAGMSATARSRGRSSARSARSEEGRRGRSQSRSMRCVVRHRDLVEKIEAAGARPTSKCKQLRRHELVFTRRTLQDRHHRRAPLLPCGHVVRLRVLQTEPRSPIFLRRAHPARCARSAPRPNRGASCGSIPSTRRSCARAPATRPRLEAALPGDAAQSRAQESATDATQARRRRARMRGCEKIRCDFALLAPPPTSHDSPSSASLRAFPTESHVSRQDLPRQCRPDPHPARGRRRPLPRRRGSDRDYPQTPDSHQLPSAVH